MYLNDALATAFAYTPASPNSDVGGYEYGSYGVYNICDGVIDVHSHADLEVRLACGMRTVGGLRRRQSQQPDLETIFRAGEEEGRVAIARERQAS